MSGIKGYPSTKKLVGTLDGYTAPQSKTDMEFVTAQRSYDQRIMLDVLSRFAFRLHSAVKTVNANSTARVIIDTAHGAQPGDFIRFELASENPYFEATILSCPDADTMILAQELPATPVAGDEYFIMRYATQRVDESGAQSVFLDPNPLVYADSIRNDYASVNVTSGAWVQLIATVGAVDIRAISLFDSGGYTMELGVGAAMSEARTLLIPPGGFNGIIEFEIPAGSRLSIRAVGAALVDLGEIVINLFE
jgi:hypothetical protein